ncbi:MAG: AAA family ATPase [Planctomycetaceae bacterium]|jgi:type II secretory pathway predicted ATPase ExeA|nr:AAA family ATPase [Planctomycetaceae bacterium]
MYETFFGLKRRPFLAVPDTESYFSTEPVEEALQSIERTVRRGEGIALLFGASGTGKTLLLRLLRDSLEIDYTVSMISNGHLETPKSFFQQLLYDLQLPFAGNDETELRLRLFDFARQNKTCVILIDESQFLSMPVLEEIRQLMNCDNGTTPFFRVVLTGTVEFEEKLTDPYLDTFNQRVVYRAYLETFSREETKQYIIRQTDLSRKQCDNFSVSGAGLMEWIEHSGGSEGRRIDSPHIKSCEPIFTENAQWQIFQLTDGLPRSINQLCDMALQIAAERNLQQIDENLTHYAWTRLQQITGYSEEKTAKLISETIKPSSFENIDEIVARKKATFQLKTFDSPVEFGTLDDAEPIGTAEKEIVEKEIVEKEIIEKEIIEKEAAESDEITIIRFRSPNEYKPPYPEDDHWEDEYKEEYSESIISESYLSQLHLSESNLSEPDSPEQDVIEITNKLLPLVPKINTVHEYHYSEETPETDEKPLNFYEELDEELDNEILFSSDSFPRLRELPISEELDDAIQTVAESVAEKNITQYVNVLPMVTEEYAEKNVAEDVEVFQTITEEDEENTENNVAENIEVFQTVTDKEIEENIIYRLPKRIYPSRRQRVKKNILWKYRRRIIISTISTHNIETPDQFCCHFFAVSIFPTFRRFDSGDTWIGNFSFYPSLIFGRFLVSFRHEPLVNKLVINEQVTGELTTDETVTDIDNTTTKSTTEDTQNSIDENTTITDITETITDEIIEVETVAGETLTIETETPEYHDIVAVESVTAESDTVESITAESDTVESVTAESDTVESVTAESDTVESVTAESDTVESVTAESITVESDTVESITVESDTVESVTAESDTVESVTAESVVAAETNDTVNNDLLPEEIIVDLNRNNSLEESEMDWETLEKYGTEVLERRPPFVRKEPNYAYQTTDLAQEMTGKVAYPDRVTGNVILLNWVKSEQNPENGFGTPYREFLTREMEDNCNVYDLHTHDQEQACSYNEFDALRVVRATLNQVTDSSQHVFVPQNQKTSLDELFDEIITVKTQAVPLKESSERSGSPYALYLNNYSFPTTQIEEALRRITKAAEKIEQAAEQSDHAGRQIKQAAGIVEAEIKTVLPTYVEHFRELVAFQQTISRELNTILLKNQITQEQTEHLNPKEHSIRLLPFPVRRNTGSVSSAQLDSEGNEISPPNTVLPNEKSIDFHSLFQ